MRIIRREHTFYQIMQIGHLQEVPRIPRNTKQSGIRVFMCETCYINAKVVKNDLAPSLSRSLFEIYGRVKMVYKFFDDRDHPRICVFLKRTTSDYPMSGILSKSTFRQCHLP